jgi:O-methyltransferase
MKTKAFVDGILKRVGYQLKRAPDAEYQALIREIYGLYRHHIFPNLPECTPDLVELLAQLQGTNISEAIYILHSLLESMHLPGDICEFGVAQGLTSALMAHEIKSTEKRIWLFDSFAGLPKPTGKDRLKDDIFGLGSIEAYQGTMACSVDMVRGTLEAIRFPLSRARIVSGFIEEAIHREDLPPRVCFAYVDFDFYEPILIALEFLDSRLTLNGRIVVDDYDWFSTGAKTAVDEFVTRHGSHYEFSLPIEGAGHFALLHRVG